MGLFRLITIILSTCVPLLAFAESTPTVKKLMNKPVSIFDFGLFKLEQKIQTKHPEADINVYYNLNENKIYVTAKISIDNIKKDISPKEMCKNKTRLLKIEAMALGAYVCPAGLTNDTDAQFEAWNTVAELNKIILLEVQIIATGQNKPLAHSISTLQSEDVFFKE